MDHYALILWGSITEGKRPGTALAWIFSDGCRARLVNPDGSPRYKRSRPVTDADIVYKFGDSLPTPREVRAAKATLASWQDTAKRC